MPEKAVTVKELTRTFGEFVAVDRISFDVAYGEVFGFLGPNGAGKTTTIKMLTGLLLPTSGEATVVGYDLNTATEQIKQRLGYMSQAFSLYGDLTVDENIEFFSGLYGVPRAKRPDRQRWVVEMANLGEHRRRLVRELSLGWKQRLALGCAVLHEPPILFLDEPTSGVDPISRRAFWDLIYELADGGTTVFVTTHYMEEAEYCNRLALMNRGRIIALDTPVAIHEKLGWPLLEIACSDSVRGVRLLQEHPLVRQAGLYGRVIHLVVDDAATATRELPPLLAAHDIAVTSVRQIEPSLEDVFVTLVHAAGGAAGG